MSDSGKAVFLSYAREDAEVARRIAEALRGFGVEVWFDQAELRGGDAWDQKIRKQIRECALFVPVISARTQQREEGYFRREWKLAVERTADMAAGVAFIVPVVIDDTAETEALVPEEFMRVQWTRLEGGGPDPAFVDHVRQLLGGRRRPAMKSEGARPPTLPPMIKAEIAARKAAAAQAGAPAKRSGFPGWTWGALTAVVVGVGVALFVALRPKPAPTSAGTPTSAAPAGAESSPSSPSTPALPDDKSIAVLPFTNMSEDKDSGYFADGVHEDVLTNLAKISELKVIARTSVMEYRGTTKKIPQIARELGVAYILEGSIRRAGNRVRVVCQLIDGRTGRHVLAPEPFDRDLADIFAIQSEIAQGIAAKLQAALAPMEKATLERAPTANLVAYELYLKAREVIDRQSDLRLRDGQARALLESALQLDPKFAKAWEGLGLLHLGAYYRFDQTESRRLLAKEAIEKARELEPRDGSILALQTNYFIDVRDLVRARELAARLEREHPSLPVTWHVLARLTLRGDDPRAALAHYRKGHSLDPRNIAVLEALVGVLRGARRYDEALAVLREAGDLVENSPTLLWMRATMPYFATGSTREMETLVRQLTPVAERGDRSAISILAGWATIRGDADELIRLRERLGSNFSVPWGREDSPVAMALLIKGRREEARVFLEQERARYRERLASRPDNLDNWFGLAATHALLGDREGTFAVKREMLAANPGLTKRQLGRWEEFLLLAWLGDKEAALDKLAEQLADGDFFWSVHVMRSGLRCRPLQGDPRFEAILNDPRNSAPLF